MPVVYLSCEVELHMQLLLQVGILVFFDYVQKKKVRIFRAGKKKRLFEGGEVKKKNAGRGNFAERTNVSVKVAQKCLLCRAAGYESKQKLKLKPVNPQHQ